MRRAADLGVIAVLVGACIASLFLAGPASSAGDVAAVLTGGGDTMARTIVVQVRLPRILLAVAVGAALAMAGCALQALLANPLADPFLLGISGGGAAAATAAFVILPVAHLGLVPLTAMAGAGAATGLVWWLARGPMGPSPTRMILAGVAVNAAASAIILALLSLARSQRLPGALAVTMGSFAGASLSQVLALTPYLLVPVVVLLAAGRDLDLMATGEESASALGVELAEVRRRVFLAAAALCGGAVAFAGVIGFVGLIVPHMARLIWGHDTRRLFPRVAVAGAALTVLGDLVARRVLSPADLPVGVVTAVVGVPFFVALLRRSP